MKKIKIAAAVFAAMAYPAQKVGIGTTNPDQVLHVDSFKNNSTNTTSTKNYDDLVVSNLGQLGIGNNAPVTRLDIRSDEENNALGIGYSSKTASAAGAGTLRYNGTTNFIEYSDGTNWISIGRGNTQDFILANSPTSVTVTDNTTSSIINWTERTDVNDTFVPGTGVFTAKFPGIYVASLNIAFTSGTIADNSNMEVIISSTGNSTTNISDFKCLITYPGYQTGSAINTSNGSCSGIFNLQTGDQISAKVINRLGANRTIDSTNTNFTIFGL